MNQKMLKMMIALITALLLVFPVFISDFWLVQIGAQTFVYGLIALGLTLLGGSGGMVSLAQMVIAGLAGYCVAIFGINSAGLGMDLPWPLTVVLAISLAAVFGTIIGLISIRTEGIYTIMITLAIATGFFYFTRQNYAVFNGFTGYSGIKAPVILGHDLRSPATFYYLTLACAALGLAGISYITRSTWGLALQGCRDDSRRMRSLGFNVNAYKVSAYTLAAVLAGVGGVLMVWMNNRIDPASIGVGPTIDVLVMAVIGGLGHPIGAFIGALIFTLLDNFAIDLIDRERFNTVIGTFFLLIVLFSPDGVLELWKRLSNRLTGHK